MISNNDEKKSKSEEVVMNAPIPVPLYRHLSQPQYSLCRVGLEVYVTDEENYKPYVSSSNTADQSSDENEETEKSGVKLHMGEIIGTYYENKISSMSFEGDYSEMSESATIKLDEVDLLKYYKGARIQLLCEWEQSDEILTWEDLKSAISGFIMEQTFSFENVDIKLNGMSRLMEEKCKFEFSSMKRSEIIREVILTAGLKPVINVEGLDDDVTDFSNASKDSGSSSSGSFSSSGSESIDEAVKKAVGNETDALKKAKAIDKAFKSYIYYKYYYDCNFSDIEKAWKNGHLNCADGANVLCAMFNSAGLTAVIVHVPSHYIVKVTIGGKDYYTDNAANTGQHTTRPFGQTWKGMTSGSVVGKKIPM